ncbi:hypothetical protein GTO89_04645 [Heliobacterium gestii]|uniref:Lipoprotein n=1 Tax=Heliomicrobium gestii TaxID=2699 RepID=A0A845LCF1_HELGE|nr:hypothetical protein [Heliomicrobium gestii]MBM7866902.1 uncharacterized protein YceK [Heliomicrobium gestii]MZP42329.1 hypothetical protein [Heliomicrobium gestii]
MKQTIIILFFALMSIFTLSGCGTISTIESPNPNPIPTAKNDTQTPTTLPNNAVQSKARIASNLVNAIDTPFVSRYIEALDICLSGNNELIFTKSEGIPSEQLYIFAIYAIDQEFFARHSPNESTSSGDAFFDRKDRKYHIPVPTIHNVLDRYFEKTIFDPTKIDGYDPAKNEIVTKIFAGFGGARNIKVSKVEQISNDSIRITADFYNMDNSMVIYRKIYTMKHTANGWKYISITKS